MAGVHTLRSHSALGELSKSGRLAVEFAELKRQIKLRRVRLRRLWNVGEQFYLAVTAQNFLLTRHVRWNKLCA
jgi:hypothetical protein